MTRVSTPEEFGNDERGSVSHRPAAVLLHVADTAEGHERDERRRLA